MSGDWEGVSRTPIMEGREKSDRVIVPGKSPNDAEASAEEAMEGSALTKGNTSEADMRRAQDRVNMPSGLERVRMAARKDRRAKFTTLFHHITVELLGRAFDALNRRAAAGVDGVTWADFAEDRERKLADLHARLHRGAYHAKPSRRSSIAKADGKPRLLGIAALEDKIVQRALVWVLEAIYETDFCDFSYGFRPGRKQHDALDALAWGLRWKKVNWVLDADIRSFFDTIDHGWLLKFLEHRIGDKRILRLIQKWLSAGVMDEGTWRKVDEGTPQGATVSPLLANIFLHYVFDLWAQQWSRRHARGDVIIARYADDFVVGFQYEHEAKRFMQELAERLEKFALQLHPEKTRLLMFGRYAAERRQQRGLSRPETFDFLGFTHICGKSRTRKFILMRRTVRKRLRAKLKQIRGVLKRGRHRPIAKQGTWLAAVVRGYLNYHAVPTNSAAIRLFCDQVRRAWLAALRRRSDKARLVWAKFSRLAARWIPRPRILHPWPDERHASSHPR
jgi:RNA-directed DNA polymerase